VPHDWGIYNGRELFLKLIYCPHKVEEVLAHPPFCGCPCIFTEQEAEAERAVAGLSLFNQATSRSQTGKTKIFWVQFQLPMQKQDKVLTTSVIL
jgi:hypothetical protein